MEIAAYLLESALPACDKCPEGTSRDCDFRISPAADCDAEAAKMYLTACQAPTAEPLDWLVARLPLGFTLQRLANLSRCKEVESFIVRSLLPKVPVARDASTAAQAVEEFARACGSGSLAVAQILAERRLRDQQASQHLSSAPARPATSS